MNANRAAYLFLIVLSTAAISAVIAARDAYGENLTPEPHGEVSRYRYWPGVGPTASATLKPGEDLQIRVEVRKDSETANLEPEREPWVVLTVTNRGNQTWYLNRDAICYGLELVVTDRKSGEAARLKPESRRFKEPALTGTRRRVEGLKPGGETRFELSLGDLAELKKGKVYKASFSWTLNVCPLLQEWRPNWEADPGFSPVLRSNTINVPGASKGQ